MFPELLDQAYYVVAALFDAGNQARERTKLTRQQALGQGLQR
jgi:hypothetical protein